MSEPNLFICVYGCDKIEKYKDEIIKCQETWVKTAQKHNVPVLFFLGESPTNLTGSLYVNLPGVIDDYDSVSDKQFLGLEYVSKRFSPSFIFCCGTDTYPNIPKLLNYLKDFDPETPLYIGGHGCKRQFGNHVVPFHSGGPGFILSRETIRRCSENFKSMKADWKEFCVQNSNEGLSSACDVAIAYFVSLPSVAAQWITNDDGFFHCNYRGFPCHLNLSIEKILSCHSMSLSDFDNFTRILEENNYFC
jgi:hypothetical protein